MNARIYTTPLGHNVFFFPSTVGLMAWNSNLAKTKDNEITYF